MIACFNYIKSFLLKYNLLFCYQTFNQASFFANFFVFVRWIPKGKANTAVNYKTCPKSCSNLIYHFAIRRLFKPAFLLILLSLYYKSFKGKADRAMNYKTWPISCSNLIYHFTIRHLIKPDFLIRSSLYIESPKVKQIQLWTIIPVLHECRICENKLNIKKK